MMKVGKAMEVISSNGPAAAAIALVRSALETHNPLPLPGVLRGVVASYLDAHPSDPDALYVMLFLMDGETERILFALRCVQQHPKDAKFHMILGHAWAFKENFDAAVRSIDRALELKHNPDWLYSHASALLHSGKQEKAAGVFQTFLKENPPDHRKVPEVHYSLGAIHLARKEEKEAKRHWRLGLAAENSPPRLPIYPPIQNFPMKMLLQAIFGGGRQQ
jgi:Flp pilus assembly protein TadD